MEKPLRDHPHIHKLIKELEGKEQLKQVSKISKIGMTQTISLQELMRIMAVLSFSGITDKQEIERFFDFARKRREVTLLVRVMIKKVLV